MNTSFILNHLGEDRENYKYAVSPPIFQTSNFTFSDLNHMRESLQDEMNNHFYTRGCNPTVAILRKKLAALENAEDALVFGSGIAAITSAVMAHVNAGDHIICVQKPYSWTYKLLVNLLSRFGVTHTFIDGTNAANFEQAIQPNTKVIFLESPNSLTFELQDLEAVAHIAQKRGITTMIDNSYCTPLYQKPIDLGIDISIHTASKYLNGHSDIVAGVLCASKKITSRIFESEFMTLGGIISPNDAWLMMRGLRTLPLRLERSAKSAEKIVAWLKGHPRVDKIYFPFLPTNSQYKLAIKQMKGACGLFSMELKADSMEEVERFCNKLQYFLMACSWGGHESLIFPMCVLHGSANYSKTDKPWNFIRFYIGLEEPDVLIADIEQAFAAMNVAGRPAV